MTAPAGRAHGFDPYGGEILSVVGERIRVLADAASTGGRAAIFEETTAPGMGPPLHRHGRDDEYFFVVEGTVKFVVDGREFTVEAGGFALAPRGSTHTFRNVGSSPSKMQLPVQRRAGTLVWRCGLAALCGVAPWSSLVVALWRARDSYRRGGPACRPASHMHCPVSACAPRRTFAAAQSYFWSRGPFP